MWLFYQDVYPEGQRPPVLPAAISSAPRKWPGRWKGLTKALLPEERAISERQREMMYRSQCRAEPSQGSDGQARALSLPGCQSPSPTGPAAGTIQELILALSKCALGRAGIIQYLHPMEEACSRKGKLSGLLVVRFCCLRGSPGVISLAPPHLPDLSLRSSWAV